jgi:hypothetical protein
VSAAFVPDSFRWGSSSAPLLETLLIVAALAVMAVAVLLGFKYLRRRERRAKPVADQWQARTAMGELCPNGWQARITLYGWGAPIPDDAPTMRVPPVELEWKQFDEQPGRVAIARRVWAASLDEALQSMVDDRRTDIALEQIEREW